MHSKQICKTPRTIVVILDTGGEIVASLKRFAKKNI